MPVAPLNGLRLHTQTMGAAGPPVCMLHGLLVGSMTTWYFAAAPRLARAHRVLLFDLRGHGLSERPARGYGTVALAGDLDALLAGFAPDEPVALVGHSYGALAALRYAMLRPERVARLALVEAPLPPWRIGELGDFVAQGPGEMLRSLPPALAGAVLRGGRAAARLLGQLRALADTSLFSDLAAESDFADDLPCADRLAALRLPVLCLYGDRSSCLPGGRRLAEAIPGARLATLPGGHFLPVEAPAAVADELERFCG